MRIADTARALLEEAKRQGREALDEPSAKSILNLYGIATPRSVVVADSSVSDEQLLAQGDKVVVKLISPDVLHKSDFGGVAIGLHEPAQIRSAMDAMAERCRGQDYRVDGFLIEEQVHDGHELVIGGFQDSTFGPVIMLGLGGIFVEILNDVSFRICPISEIDAREMLHELRAAAVLKGARGQTPVPECIVTDALLAVGGENGLFFRLADCIEELDINPLVVSSSGAMALDARIVLGSEQSE